MENPNNNDIVIKYSELEDAAENIIYDEYPEDYERMNRDSVMKVLKKHLEYAIEDILSEPLKHFRKHKNFWKDMQDGIYLDNDI